MIQTRENKTTLILLVLALGLAGDGRADGPVAADRYGDPLPAGAVARLGTVRFRHETGASHLAFSPDGKALGCNNQVVWDAATGKELYRLPENCLAISADWTTTAHVDRLSKVPPKIVLRELGTGQVVRECDWPRPDLAWLYPKLRFAPNGKTFVLINGEVRSSEAHVIDATSGKVLAACKTDKFPIFCSAFAPDSKTLALGTIADGDDNPSLQLWDMATGKRTLGIESPQMQCVSGIAFAPDGKTVAAGGPYIVVLSDVASGKPVGRLEALRIAEQSAGLAFTPDGKTLITCGGGAVRVWDVAGGTTRYNFRGGMFSPKSMALSADGKTLAVGPVGTSVVRLWNVQTGKELFAEFVGHEKEVSCLAFSPDGRTLVSGGSWQQMHFWDTAGWQHDRALKGRGDTFSFSPDGKRLVACPSNNNVVVWEVATGKDALTITVPGTDHLTAARFSPDGRKLFTLDRTTDENNQEGFRLGHWDAVTGKQEKLWTLRQGLRALLLAADGQTVVAQSEKVGTLHDVKSGRDRLLLGREEGMVSGWMQPVVLSPDGRMLATGRWRGNHDVWLWEVATGKDVLRLKGHECSVDAIVLSPDGRVVATGEGRHYGDEKKAVRSTRLWDAVTGKELARFSGYDADLTSLAFSPDGVYLAAGLRDSTILVWKVDEVTAKRQPQTLEKHQLEAYWTDLIDNDAKKAYEASYALVSAPEQAVPMLRDRLKPFAVADADKVRKLIADLDADEFATREAATKELRKLGWQARVEIDKALAGKLPEETRRRLESIADALHEAIEPETLRTVRGVMVLEKIGSPKCREVLEALARGATGARETEEAKAALERLGKRPGGMP